MRPEYNLPVFLSLFFTQLTVDKHNIGGTVPNVQGNLL